MNPHPRKPKSNRTTFSQSTGQFPWNPNLRGEQLALDRAVFQFTAVPEGMALPGAGVRCHLTGTSLSTPGCPLHSSGLCSLSVFRPASTRSLELGREDDTGASF